jgi:vacuolar-type H+-ATPase subunit E/Vma4
MAENTTAKGLSVAQSAKNDTKRPRNKVQRHSPDRLLRRPVRLEGGVIVSAERHKGRVMVRVESLNDEQ